MLYTGCILNDNAVGTRISIMSRHTLNDRVTPDIRITDSSYDEWLRILAPSDRLIGEYYGNSMYWGEFAARYTSEINDGAKVRAVEGLALRAIEDDVTILCIEDSHETCHRGLLAKECQRYFQHLKVIHLDN